MFYADESVATVVVNRKHHTPGAGGRKDVFIGRQRGAAGIGWGNPFIIGRDGDRETVIAKHLEYLRASPELLDRLPELVGANLVCFCVPDLPCHGQNFLTVMRELGI